jgi:hypothetical protein
MDIKKARLIGAGKALSTLDEGAQVKRVRVDGEEVDAGEATEAILDAIGKPEEREPSALRGAMLMMTEALGGGVDHMEKTLSKTELGKSVATTVRKEPENVSVVVKVEIELANGETRTLGVRVSDTDVSNILRKVSLTSTSGSVVPIAGHIVSGTTALMSGLGSLVARATGAKALAQSLQGMAAKHAVIAVPFVGHAAGGIGAVVNSEGLNRSRAASIAEIVEL